MDLSHALHMPGGFDDPTFWVLVALVMFLALVTYLGVWKMVGKKLDERAAKISEELEDAHKMRQEAQELLASFQRRQREAESEAQAIVEQARADAGRFAEDARAKLNEQLERRAAAAERKIAQAEAEAAAMVRGRAADLAAATAQSLLADTLDADAHAKLVDASVGDLDKKFS